MHFDKEVLIMAHLRKNARQRLTQISRKTGIPVSTIFDAIKATTLVKKYTALLDFPKLGFTTKAMMLIKANKDSKEALREHLVKHANINSIYRINNGYDFLIEGIFKNMVELEEFVEKLEERFGIKTKELHYILEDIKREEFLADPQMLNPEISVIKQ